MSSPTNVTPAQNSIIWKGYVREKIVDLENYFPKLQTDLAVMSEVEVLRSLAEMRHVFVCLPPRMLYLSVVFCNQQKYSTLPAKSTLLEMRLCWLSLSYDNATCRTLNASMARLACFPLESGEKNKKSLGREARELSPLSQPNLFSCFFSLCSQYFSLARH